MTRDEALAEARRVIDSGLPEHFGVMVLARALLEAQGEIDAMLPVVDAAAKFVTALPLCCVDGCPNNADPRWFHDGKPACDGHGDA
jgi:hypothetical protein